MAKRILILDHGSMGERHLRGLLRVEQTQTAVCEPGPELRHCIQRDYAVLLVAGMEAARSQCVDLEDYAQAFVDSANLSPRVRTTSLDIGDNATFKEFISQGVTSSNVPNSLLNLTCTSTAKSMLELTGEDLNHLTHGGLTAPFLLERDIGCEMAKRRCGSMDFFFSMYGSVAPNPNLYEAQMIPNRIGYGVTKAKTFQMNRYFAVTWGRDNVRCNCLSPGPFPNPTVQQDHPEFVRRLAAKSPLGRIGEPEEIAGAVAFLSSDAASYINGHNLMVEGGWTAW